jgi:hypothetical protein
MDLAALESSLSCLMPTRCAWRSAAHGFLHRYLLHLKITPLTDVKAPYADYYSNSVSEEAILTQLMIDLSLIDSIMLQHLPSTVAAAALFLSRLILDHLSRAPLALAYGHGLIHTSSRECISLYEWRRPFVARNPSFTSQPFWHPFLGSYIRSCPREADSFLECVIGFHYRDHALLRHTEPLEFYTNLAKEYGGPDSKRGKAWKVGLSLPWATVARALAEYVWNR